WGMPALVRAHERTVDPHARAIVDGAEPQHEPRAGAVACRLELSSTEIAGVPTHLVVAGVGHARGRRLRREGHHDLASEVGALVPALLPPRIVVIEREAPDAREVAPAPAHQLRPRVGAVLAAGGHRIR